ncbi:unknown [Clostridium sp. CAG:433]|nr:unknown [Clostridium sp. CAG:433]
MYSDEEINEIATKAIYDNKLNKISDNLYLSNRQIEILKRYEIDYKKFNDIKSLMYEVETALEEVYDADDLQALSIELSEFNYYHNTNK